MAGFRIETPRLVLREWREADVDPMAGINSDPEVMAFIGPLQSRDETSRFIGRHAAMLADHGICYWAVEHRELEAIIGFCGLEPGGSGMPVEGRIEIGWRLARNVWGLGFAREAAGACIAWGFANLPVEAIWSKTVPANTRSRGLMVRLGMTYVEGADFDHPALAEGDPLRRHVLYRMARPQ